MHITNNMAWPIEISEVSHELSDMSLVSNRILVA